MPSPASSTSKTSAAGASTESGPVAWVPLCRRVPKPRSFPLAPIVRQIPGCETRVPSWLPGGIVAPTRVC